MIFNSFSSSLRYIRTSWLALLIMICLVLLYLYAEQHLYVAFRQYLLENLDITSSEPLSWKQHMAFGLTSIVHVLLVNIAFVPVVYLLSRNIILKEDIVVSALRAPIWRNYLRILWVLFFIGIVSQILSIAFNALFSMGIYLWFKTLNFSSFIDPFYLILSLSSLVIVALIQALFFLAPGLAAIGKRNALQLSTSLVKGCYLNLYAFLLIFWLVFRGVSFLSDFLSRLFSYEYGFTVHYVSEIFLPMFYLFLVIFMSFFLRQILIERQSQ